MTVRCFTGCGAVAHTATSAQKAGWARMVCTVGRLTPKEGGLRHFCPECWKVLDLWMALKEKPRDQA